jgi:hypothetical protein
MSTDRLVELFVQSARASGTTGEPSALSALPQDGGHLDDEALERGCDALEKMLTSEDGLRMGLPPESTFVCVAMALEEKPLLQNGAVRCYEKALEWLDRRLALRSKRGEKTTGSWERAVVLQQVGMVCIRQKRVQEAARHLEECSQEAEKTEGHPREATLFEGAFNTQQSRMEFLGMVAKLCANVYKLLGDEMRCQRYMKEVERLSRLQSVDAVERAVARDEAEKPSAESGTTKGMDAKALWAATPAEERRLKEYGFTDEGSTVSLLLDLNDHLGIGTEASDAVSSLKQFKVNCEKDSVDVRVRIQRKDGRVCEFQLLLEPLAHEIIPEDTVPKLKGREGKRRLEVKLFKDDKKQPWYNKIVKSVDKAKTKTDGSKTKTDKETKSLGTQLNPLTVEELARLPRPSGSGSDNRPSTWQSGPVLLHKEEEKEPVKKRKDSEPVKPASPQQEFNLDEPASPPHAKTETSAMSNGLTPPAPLPPWVAMLDERQPPGGMVEIDVHLSEDAGDAISMEDLELDGDATAGLRLSLKSHNSPLVIATPRGVDFASMRARWRRKTRTLELRLPFS